MIKNLDENLFGEKDKIEEKINKLNMKFDGEEKKSIREAVVKQLECSKKSNLFCCSIFPKQKEFENNNINWKLFLGITNSTFESMNTVLKLFKPQSFEEAKKYIEMSKKINSECLKEKFNIDNFEYDIVLSDKNGEDLYLL